MAPKHGWLAEKAARYFILSLLGLVCLSGCALFSRKPALPKQSSIEALTAPRAEEELLSLIDRSDIIYFPTENVVRASGYERAHKLVELALRRETSLFIGWDAIDADQQPALDTLRDGDFTADGSTAALTWLGGTASTTNLKLLLHSAVGSRNLALSVPAALAARIRSGASLTRDEQETLHTDFKAPALDLAGLAERFSTAGRVSDRDLPKLYNAWLVSSEFAAAKIVQGMEDHRGGKALIFLRGRALEGDLSVPNFVAQKLAVRQLVLEVKSPPRDESHVLALAGTVAAGGL